MLAEIFKKNKCDKYGHNYAPFYELVTGIREPESILEIGFMHGASMMSWRDRFPGADLTALEINTNRPMKKPSPPFQLIDGDFRDFNPVKKYDWIIDDGSHQGHDIFDAFQKFWDSVSPGGFYIIEDLHCGFWPDFVGRLGHVHGWYELVQNTIASQTHRSGNESLQSLTGFVIQQKSIIGIQKVTS